MNSIEIIARGLLVKDNYFLVCRPINKTYVYLPGGHVEFFETTQNALIREWQEELNCPCQIDSLLTFFEERFTDYTQQKHHEYTFLYQVNCEVLNPSTSITSNEPHINFEWIPLKDLKKQPLLPKSIQTYLLENLSKI